MGAPMYATRHAVFVGPGKLPDELRHVLLKRAQAPQPDIAIQVPRLLATFESAAEAERISGQVQRLKLGSVVAGPEQPPAEGAWACVTQCVFAFEAWRVTTTLGEQFNLHLDDIRAVSIVDWRPQTGAADRAVLLTVREGRPLFLRASALDTVSRQSVPLDGIRTLTELLEAAAKVLPADTRVRNRKLVELDLRGPNAELQGDLLPLAMSMLDAVDSLQGELPRPLRGGATSTEAEPHAEHTPLAAVTAWVSYFISLAGLVISLGALTTAAVAWSLPAGAAGVLLGATATRRFMWSRWLARSNWGDRSPLPPWPIDPNERGMKPQWIDLALEVSGLAALLYGANDSTGLVHAVCFWSLPVSALGIVLTLLALFEARHRT